MMHFLLLSYFCFLLSVAQIIHGKKKKMTVFAV